MNGEWVSGAHETPKAEFLKRTEVDLSDPYLEQYWNGSNTFHDRF